MAGIILTVEWDGGILLGRFPTHILDMGVKIVLWSPAYVEFTL